MHISGHVTSQATRKLHLARNVHALLCFEVTHSLHSPTLRPLGSDFPFQILDFSPSAF